MRVTGGRARGIPIRAPSGLRTRPTTDKVREALFGTLGSYVSETSVLDLFAGCGTLAIEALSRGAKFATFVENNAIACRFIENNLKKTGFSEKARIIRTDFRSAIRRLERKGAGFDLVLIDPPYQSNLLDEAAEMLAKHHIIIPTAVVVVEHFPKRRPPSTISNIPLNETRRYGQTALSYYVKKG